MRIARNVIKTVTTLMILACLCLVTVVPAVAQDAEAELIPESWFDDALFIGDSLTGSLGTYTLVNGGLGNAMIVYMNGLACHNIVNSKVEIGFMGRTCTVEQIVEKSGAEKLFIMLAMNDIGYPVGDLKICWEKMLGKITAKCPEVKIFIQSGTPVRTDNLYFTQKNMTEYNSMLEELCSEYGYVYVDVTDGIKDDEGFMKKEFQQEYTNDNVHLNFNGCEVWVNNLRNPDSYSVPPVYRGIE